MIHVRKGRTCPAASSLSHDRENANPGYATPTPVAPEVLVPSTPPTRVADAQLDLVAFRGDVPGVLEIFFRSRCGMLLSGDFGSAGIVAREGEESPDLCRWRAKNAGRVHGACEGDDELVEVLTRFDDNMDDPKGWF